MLCLNHRIGVLFRQNLAKKSYELRYFFIDDQANLFYISSLPKLQKVIRLSKDTKEIKIRLQRLGEKFFNLNLYNITAPKAYNTESVLPFGNRTCIEMKQKQQKDTKSNEKTAYMLLGLMDEDTVSIYDEILHLSGKKKREPIKRKSVSTLQKKEEQIEEVVFESYIECSSNFSMQKDKQVDNQYEGEKVNGKAEGKGKQIIVSKGMTYNGIFKDGKKHGRGYLVNKTLDTLECEFLDDELAGI